VFVKKNEDGLRMGLVLLVVVVVAFLIATIVGFFAYTRIVDPNFERNKVEVMRHKPDKNQLLVNSRMNRSASRAVPPARLKLVDVPTSAV
jgi:hypothetical protein